MGQAITVVDSFTDAPFSGNPAGVCLLAAPTTETWMLAVAAELNLAETAFAVPRPDGDLDLRWFTPVTEVGMCGHATLATAHVLGGAARFHTLAGVLTCSPGDGGTIRMDFPALAVPRAPGHADCRPARGRAAARGGGGRAGERGGPLAARRPGRGARPRRR